MDNYSVLKNHSWYSILKSSASTNKIATRCSDIGIKNCSLTDSTSISGMVQFFKSMKKQKIKPIAGSEFCLDKNLNLTVLAKNYDGWSELIRLTSLSNLEDHFADKPKIKLEEFHGCKHLIGFSGTIGSDLSACLFTDYNLAFSAKTLEQAQLYVSPDAIKNASELALQYQDIFGKGNFFIEIQLVDKENSPCSILVADILREVSKKTDIKCIATPNPYYPEKIDAFDQRILLCTSLNKTLIDIQEKMSTGKDIPLSEFFRSNNFHIPTFEEMIINHNSEELENTNLVASMCEEYSLESKPILPKFPTPNNMDSDEYLKELCRNGWRNRKSQIEDVIKRLPQYSIDTYAERMKKEFGVLQKAGLSDYFLIVKDIVDNARNRGEYIGVGRGSAAGSLTLYLLGVTGVDPIEHDLIFERFYNEGRNTEGNISLPDVDLDFERASRNANLQYCEDRFGKDNVAQIMTFGTLKGASVIKDVFRAHAAAGFEEINRMTKHIPKAEEISDELAEMAEANDGESSIIQWCLENIPKVLEDWVQLQDDGTITGKYGKLFEQSIRLEGCKRSLGRHPSGVIITHKPLQEICPVVNVGGHMVAGMEMGDLEALGMCKFDLLSTSVLDKCHMITNQLLTGKMGYDD